MGSFALLVLGMLIVVVGIIAFRWHPFIALVTAALAVSLLTPEERIFKSGLSVETRALHQTAEERGGAGGEPGARDPSSAAPPVLDPARADELRAAKARSGSWFVSRVTGAFGAACGGIALVIAMASIIGKCLLDSGGARRIVDSLMRLFGLRGTPIAFAASSFTLGIPVFFDTVFYLLMPLGKALRRKTGRDYLLYILTIVAGATMAHSLVPPTPGPLTVAAFFGDEVSLGSMMIGGLVVGMFTVSVGILYAYWANRRWEIPLRDDGIAGDEEIPDDSSLPRLGVSLLPIALPVLLIGGETAFNAAGIENAAIRFLGDKNIALMLAAGAALLLLVRSRLSEGAPVREAVQEALSSAGIIILVTAAGASFGSALKDTDIAYDIGKWFDGGGALALIPLAFGVTAMVRTAQGSATVAMITAGGMIAPLATQGDLPYSALYLALAIGCGSKPISWANDSGFWVIGRMTGMTPLETFKTVSVMMMVMAFVGLAVVLAGAVLVPLK